MYNYDFEGKLEFNDTTSFNFLDNHHLEDEQEINCFNNNQLIFEDEEDCNDDERYYITKDKKTQNISDSKTRCTYGVIEKQKKNKEVYFKFEKGKKKVKLGRNSKNEINPQKNQHTKDEINNIITKIKRNVMSNIIYFINFLLKISDNPRIKERRLNKIDQSLIIVCKKEQNLELLETKLKDLLSSEISIKYRHFDKNYNKELIDIILEEDDENIKDVLNKTLEDMVNIYVQDVVEDNIYKDFGRLKDDKSDILELYESDGTEYFNKYEAVAKNLKSIISARPSRNRSSNKTKTKAK